MSNLESALVAAAQAFLGVMTGQAAPVQAAPAAPSYPPPQAPAPVPQAPPAMPTQPFQAPAPAAPAGLPFNDNVTAAAWATAAWTQAAAVNQDQAMALFQGLMQQLGAADFNSLTPDKFPVLYQGIQNIKAQMGIQG